MEIFVICSVFELGGITNHLMTDPSGNSSFCFPRDQSLSVYYFTERKLLLNSKKEEKMIGHHTRLQESDDLPKLCAVRMRNAILRNDLNRIS